MSFSCLTLLSVEIAESRHHTNNLQSFVLQLCHQSHTHDPVLVTNCSVAVELIEERVYLGITVSVMSMVVKVGNMAAGKHDIGEVTKSLHLDP